MCGNLSFTLRVFFVVYSDDRDASFQLSDDDVSDGGTDDIDTEAYNSSDIERDEARRKRAKEHLLLPQIWQLPVAELPSYASMA